MLEWIGRFRFVTAEALALRFEVSVRRVNASLSRLEAAGLVNRHREHVSQARVIWLTRAGALAVDLPVRRPPRTETQRRHELAIARLVAELELADEGGTVRTERECRQLHDERDRSRRYSVELIDSSGRTRRWPDVVIESSETRIAYEIEFAHKAPRRLKAIVDAYRFAAFDEIRWLVDTATLAKRLRRFIDEYERFTRMQTHAVPTQTVAPWLEVDAAMRARIEAALLAPVLAC